MEKIYVTDLDGTLLGNDGKLSDYSRTMLRQLIGDGANISLASARNLASIRRLMCGVQFRLPVIEINGSFLSDYNTGCHLRINDIPSDIAWQICRLCEEHNCMPFVAAFDGKEDHLFYETLTNEGMEWFLADKSEDHSERLKQRKLTAEILDMHIVCFVVIGKMEVVKRLNTELREKFGYELDSYFFCNPYSPQWQWLTIHDKNAQKSNGIHELLELKGFSYQQLTVFGDNDNDKAMMEMNKLGAVSVAVENAVDQIKAAASKICQSNQNDGVVRYIAEDFYGS